jgi:Na+/H+-dicarboxylate symporter/ABC-type amino acid transport substrate-binding protein
MSEANAGTAQTSADADSTATAPKRRGPGLAMQVLIGLVLGVIAGIVFGEWMSNLKIIGDVFVGLLQMTVLPYIVVSLVYSLGRLSYEEIGLLAKKSGAFILVFWGIAIFIIVSMVIAFPSWPSAAFFSTSLIEEREPVDFVKLYIPSNPFASLANGVVPAIVLVSLAGGLALSGVSNKQYLLKNLEMASDAIMRIAQFVVQLAPLGVFALVGAMAGTISVEELGRLQVYILTYIGAALLLSFFILPGIVAIMTPIPFSRVITGTQDALITAFATYNLLIVLPLLSERIKQMLDEVDQLDADSESAADLIVPINFNLPNLGKLLGLSFIPFAGWFAGSPISIVDYPQFLTVGLFSFFGEVVVALPFLLDLMRIPADTFQVFLAIDQVSGRFGTLLAGMHTVVLGLLTAVAVNGKLRVNWVKIGRHAVISVLLIFGLFGGLRLFFEYVVPQEYRLYHALTEMELVSKRVDTKIVPLEVVKPLEETDERGRIEVIRNRGSLNIGYVTASLPFAYRRESEDLIGLEIDILHLLANDLGVALNMIEIERDEVADLLNDGRIDIAIGGLFATPERAMEFQLSEPYMNASLSLIVRDHRRGEFAEWDQVRAMTDLKLALVDIPFYVRRAERAFPFADIVVVESPRDFLDAPEGKFDALIYSAEAGSAWTLLYPSFSVVLPKPGVISVPVVFGLPSDAPALTRYINAWMMLNKSSRQIDRLYKYWILGQGASKKKKRWSVVHNVLGWD